MVKDQIANFIIALKNASTVGKESITFPYSKTVQSIAELLLKEGYVKAVSRKGKKINKFIEVKISYDAAMPAITGAERLSSFSKRTYVRTRDIRDVRRGFGLMVMSTTKGIMSGKDARKERVGGEMLFRIW